MLSWSLVLLHIADKQKTQYSNPVTVESKPAQIHISVVWSTKSEHWTYL